MMLAIIGVIIKSMKHRNSQQCMQSSIQAYRKEYIWVSIDYD